MIIVDGITKAVTQIFSISFLVFCLLFVAGCISPEHLSKKNHEQLYNVLYKNSPTQSDLDYLRSILSKQAGAFRKTDSKGNTIYHISVLADNPHALSVLLESGNTFDVRGEMGLTPLILASKMGRIECVSILLDAGSDINAKDRSRFAGVDMTGPGSIREWGALHYAVERNSEEIACLLLEKGAEPNIEARNGWTPIFMAARNRSIEMCKNLLEYGAMPNKQDKDGNTPLHYAIYWTSEEYDVFVRNSKNPISPDRIKVMSLLLKSGANPLISNKKGQTPADIAKGIQQDDPQANEFLQLLYN